MRFLKYWEIWGGFWEIWGGFSKFRSPKIKTRRHTSMLSKYEVLTPNNRGERSDWSSRSTNRQNFQESSKNHCHKIFDSRLNLPKLWLDLSPRSVNRFLWFFSQKVATIFLSRLRVFLLRLGYFEKTRGYAYIVFIVVSSLFSATSVFEIAQLITEIESWTAVKTDPSI